MMQSDENIEETEQVSTAEVADHAATEDNAADAALGAEFRQVGDRLAAAIRAAVGTQEAEALRGEVSEGIRRLRDEFEEALAKAPRPRLRRGGASDNVDEAATVDVVEAAEPATGGRRTALRVDIAKALRSWAERAASTIEPMDGGGDDAPVIDADEGGQSGSE